MLAISAVAFPRIGIPTCPAHQPRERLADAGGLYLEVAPSGSKRWFWKYRFDGKEKRLALGSYPDVGLIGARASRDDARKRQQRGADPLLERQLERLSASAVFHSV